MIHQSIPPIPEHEIPDTETRRAMAYKAAMIGGLRVPHTDEWDWYSSPGIWRDGELSKAVLLTAELNRRGLNR